eukprot:IDg8494t1
MYGEASAGPNSLRMEGSSDLPRQPPMAATHHEPVDVVTAAKFQESEVANAADVPSDIVTTRKSKRDKSEKRHKRDKRKDKSSKKKAGASSSGTSSNYNVEISDIAENTLALFHNALRHEITTYRNLAIPVVGVHEPRDKDDPTIKVLLDQWSELSRFTVLVSRIEEVIAN